MKLLKDRMFIVSIIVLFILLAIIAAGSYFFKINAPGSMDNNSIALNTALNDTNVIDEIKISGGSYSSQVQPADLNVSGYINYSGNFYNVNINTANIGVVGVRYVETFNILVDVDSKKEMRVSRQFDVATFPDRILIPGDAMWYHRFPHQGWLISNGAPGAYLEIYPGMQNTSIRPVLVDGDNFSRLMQGLPYDSWSLYNLGENATEINLNSNTSVNTGINGITAIPGRIPLPGDSINGRGVKLIFNDVTTPYYLVLINDGQKDEPVEMMVQG